MNDMTIIDANGALHDRRGLFSGHVREHATEALTLSRRELFDAAAAKSTIIGDWVSQLEDDGALPADGVPAREQIRLFLEDPVGSKPDGWDWEEWERFGDSDEAHQAAFQMSQVLADGQAGRVTSTFDLRPGDRVDLSRLFDEGPDAEWARQNFSVVTDVVRDGDGRSWVSVREGAEGRPVSLYVATGTGVPVPTVAFRGVERTEREVVEILAREKKLDRAYGADVRTLLDNFIRESDLRFGDDDYPQAVI
ncbi:hypothetical protein JCM13591A_20230 [Microbacterium xylanilyticum]